MTPEDTDILHSFWHLYANDAVLTGQTAYLRASLDANPCLIQILLKSVVFFLPYVNYVYL